MRQEPRAREKGGPATSVGLRPATPSICSEEREERGRGPKLAAARVPLVVGVSDTGYRVTIWNYHHKTSM
jgi:hypothetical protein